MSYPYCFSAWFAPSSLQLWGSCIHPSPGLPASAWLTEWLLWDWQMELVKVELVKVVLSFV